MCTIGMSTLLERIIPMATIRTFQNFQDFADDTPDMYVHYFVSAQIYLEHSAFFQERRKKAIVMCAESQVMQLTGIKLLNVYQKEERIVKELLMLHSHAHHHEHTKKSDPQQAAAPELSTREIEVLSLVAKGLINKEIADRLNISLTTVITHRRNITDKLGIKSVSGLTIYAVMNGYLEADQI